MFKIIYPVPVISGWLITVESVNLCEIKSGSICLCRNFFRSKDMQLRETEWLLEDVRPNRSR